MVSVAANGGCVGVEIDRHVISGFISDVITAGDVTAGDVTASDVTASDVTASDVTVSDRHRSAPTRETWQGVRDATEQNSRTSVSPIPSTKPAMSP